MRRAEPTEELVERLFSAQWLGRHDEGGRSGLRMFVYGDAAERGNPIRREVDAMLRGVGEGAAPHYGAYEAGRWAAMLQTSLAQFVSTSLQPASDPVVLELYRRVEDLTREVSSLSSRLVQRSNQDENVSAVTEALPRLEEVGAKVFQGRGVSISVARSDDDDFDVVVRVRVSFEGLDPESKAELKGRFFEQLFDCIDDDFLKTTHFVFCPV